jgi:hypothetical protein
MSRKCPECNEGGGRVHLPGCSFGPAPQDRERYIKENAVAVVDALQEKIRRQANELNRLTNANACLRKTIARIAAESRAQALSEAMFLAWNQQMALTGGGGTSIGNAIQELKGKTS